MSLRWRHNERQCVRTWMRQVNLAARSPITSMVWLSITVTSQWARWRLKSPASRLFTLPLIQAQIKKTSKLRVIGLCAGNSPVTGEFPAQRASNAENVSIWWRHHEYHMCCLHFPATIGHTIIGNPETFFMISNDVSSSAWMMEYEGYVRIEVLASLRVDGNFRCTLLNWDV